MQDPIIENKEVEQEKVKPGKLRIIIIALILLLAGGLSYGAFRYLSVSGSGEKTASSEAEESGPSKVQTVITLDPFLVNLADPYDARFVKTTFHLGLAELQEKPKTNPVTMSAIRDAIISILSSKTADRILTAEGKESLREEIRSRVNQIEPSLKVVEVYIVDFVIQL
ncbi:MAG TPA: flagellar basal body-associated FliL family protein [Acidobacteriota bacterium]|nr:flagellar basal body-associated FliL family protein [Acidobacteriota bacterium]